MGLTLTRKPNESFLISHINGGERLCMTLKSIRHNKVTVCFHGNIRYHYLVGIFPDDDGGTIIETNQIHNEMFILDYHDPDQRKIGLLINPLEGEDKTKLECMWIHLADKHISGRGNRVGGSGARFMFDGDSRHFRIRRSELELKDITLGIKRHGK